MVAVPRAPAGKHLQLMWNHSMTVSVSLDTSFPIPSRERPGQLCHWMRMLSLQFLDLLTPGLDSWESLSNLCFLRRGTGPQYKSAPRFVV